MTLPSWRPACFASGVTRIGRNGTSSRIAEKRV
jgi:hypothetical protein